MQKHNFFLASLLVISMGILSGCSQTVTTSPTAEAAPTVAASVTAPLPTPTAEITPSPVPTEEPILPCNIAFDSERDGNMEIYTMNPDGSEQVNLTNHPADDFEPVWSPDGSQIAFASNRVTGEDGGLFIYIMRADGSEVTRISQQNESKEPDWSPLGDQITYSSKGEIYLIDLVKNSEVNITNSPEWDSQPKFSPDGQRIAWIKGDGDNRQLYAMNLDGSNVVQVIGNGTVHDAEWSVDGRIFTHWNQPDGLCFNCIVTADGLKVEDVGGKGAIQQFLPFWTADGDRVELIYGDFKGVGNEDIFLVGEIFPEIFFPITDNPGRDLNPDTASKCGPTHGVYPQYGSPEAASPVGDTLPQPGRPFVIGYTGSLNEQTQLDLDKACTELKLNCLHDENISKLADLGVDAIINSSNRWDVMGSYPQLHDAVQRGIPVFVLNADTSEPGAFNLSAEQEIYTSTLNWMFKKMGGQGEFVYYNFGNSEAVQNVVDAVLKDYPGINAIKKDADYNGNTFTQQDITAMVAKNSNLGAIWSTEQLNDIFWGINDKSSSNRPLTECLARKDIIYAWKYEIDAGSKFQCMAQIRPGGTAYEGVYVAYYYLSGLKFKTDAFTSEGGNTLKYDIPVITNESLPDWALKLDAMRVGEHDMLQLPPMTPEEIRKKWFIE